VNIAPSTEGGGGVDSNENIVPSTDGGGCEGDIMVGFSSLSNMNIQTSLVVKEDCG